MSNFDKAIEIILAEPPELHYPAYYADLLRKADVPDMNIGKCSEIPNSSETIYRQAAIDKFIDGLEDIFADLRERHVDDSVCGLCEYDGAYIGQSGDWCNECPGFEKDDCFKLSDKTRKEWTEEIIKALPSVQPEKRTEERAETHACDLIDRQAEQQGRVFKEIVVEYPSYNTYPEYKGKPYFSINYTENGQEFIGYGTYKPEVLSEYLKEYFMSSAQPERKKGK